MKRSKIVVGLEIGTTKTCMVVGEIRPDCSAVIIGGAEVKSAGISAGEIRDMALARQSLFDVWQKTQEATDVEIMQVLIAVTGDHIQGNLHRGSYRLPDNETIIDHHHVKAVTENAANMELQQDREILHREMGNFSIDGRDALPYPTGLTAKTLDLNCHIIHGMYTRIQSSVVCVRQIPLEVQNIAFSGLASSLVVLTRQQKETGALLIDIGGGTADYICYADGDIVACGCVPMGGNKINQDIMEKSDSRSISQKAAEHFKCNEGHAFGDIKDNTIAHYRTDLGHEYSIRRGRLNEIIRDRLAAILLEVKKNIPAGVWSRSGMAVYLAGGTSLMRGLDELAQFIFKVPVNQPLPPGAGDDYTYLADPKYCTALGLIRFAQRVQEERPGIWRRIFNFLLGRS